MAPWASGDVIANGIRLRYYRTGGDKPPLVLSHGFSESGLTWTRVAQKLTQDYDVILYDHRGHGLSEAPETGYTSEDRAADLKGLIEALHLGRPRALGHSMGAATVSTAAALYPNLLRCAVLEDPPWRAENPTPEQSEALRAQRRAEILARKAMTREELIASARAQHPHWHELELGTWADAKLRMSPNNAQGYSRPAPWREIARKITCPVLLLTADPALGGIVTPEVAEEAARLWRTGQVVRIADAGHGIHRDQFDAYLRALKAFLAQV